MGFYVQEAYICDDNDGFGVIKGFKIISIEAQQTARLIGSPVESGKMSFDNKVIEPIILTVKGLVRMDDFPDVDDRLFEMFKNRDWQFVSVVGKGNVWSNLMLSKMPQSETNERHDVVEYTLEFTEIIMEDSDSMGNGQSNPSSGSSYSPTQNNGLAN